LDVYLASRPALHPDAPLFAHDPLCGFWNEQTLAKTFKLIRNAAGLPANLQCEDFRRTAATEAGATVDEIRTLQRHSTRTAALHYVHPDGRSAHERRLAQRTKSAQKSD
jgi:hypothetical protein